MPITSGIFSAEPSFEVRLVDSLDSLSEMAAHLKGIGLRIVLTSGSFDLVHLGHVKYLARAKALGDVLVVGVDSDEKIRRRKGEGRPLVPERERLEMLAHQRPVDVLFLKREDAARWALIKAVRPDVLVVTADHDYTETQLIELKEFCGEVTVLERQADITTSERIRRIHMDLGRRLGQALPALIDHLIERP